MPGTVPNELVNALTTIADLVGRPDHGTDHGLDPQAIASVRSVGLTLVEDEWVIEILIEPAQTETHEETKKGPLRDYAQALLPARFQSCIRIEDESEPVQAHPTRSKDASPGKEGSP